MSPALRWRLAGFYFFYFAYLGAFAPYFTLYLAAAGFAAGQIGVLMALPQVTRVFAPHLWGWLADRHARRVAIVRATGLAGTLCYLGVYAGTGYAWLAACIALWCFFWSAALPLMETTTLAHLGERGTDYGRIRLWGSIGFVVAVVGVGWALDHLPIVALLGIVAALLGGILLLVWIIPEAGSDGHEATHVPIGRVLARPEVRALIGASFLMAVAHGPYYTFFSLHLVDHGYSKALVGWLWALGVIAEIAVFAWMPALFRRFSAHTLLVASLAIASLRFLLIGWAVDDVALLLAAQVMHAATFGAFHAAALSSIHRLFRGRNQARGQALYGSLSFGLGGTLGGLGSGYAWESLGAGPTFSLASACALGGLLLMRVVPAAAR